MQDGRSGNWGACAARRYIREGVHMLWMGIALALVASVVIVAAVVTKRSAGDLGSVSDHWIAQHRADAP